jgi:hypothetical protein
MNRNKGGAKMSSFSAIRKIAQKRQKQHLILKMMSSFVITTVIVVATVFPPTAPIVELSSAEAFGNAVYYETNVIDSDSSFSEGSLKIVAESIWEKRETPLSLGKVTGTFDDLRAGTEYEISIRASQGFGEKIFQRKTVTTAHGYGGRLTLIEMVPSSDLENPPSYLNYRINSVYNDEFEEITALRLRYAYLYPFDLMETPVPDPTDFSTVPIVGKTAETILQDIPNYNVTVFVFLDADLISGETVVLDQVIFRTPMIIHSSLYVTDVTPESIKLIFYQDNLYITDIFYTLRLLKEGVVLQSTIVPPQEPSGQFESTPPSLSFTGLLASTEYQIELLVTYIDPETQIEVTKTLQNMIAQTAPPYTATVTFTDITLYYMVNVEVSDPSGTLQNWQYVIFTVDEFGFETYLETGQLVLEDLGSGQFFGQVMLNKPPATEYFIRISVTKRLSIDLVYPDCQIDQITGTPVN